MVIRFYISRKWTAGNFGAKCTFKVVESISFVLMQVLALFLDIYNKGRIS
ncbi:hypothetical protein HMPREF1870_00372 [Bacteroidales bacterium KA00344]|nr:hypothetical protein HMPREF1870_00372 [Bacteroidales bacterium KA00344]